MTHAGAPAVSLASACQVAALATVGGALGLAVAVGDPPARPEHQRAHSQLDDEQARQQSLSASVGRLSGLIGTLDSQITLVQSREAAVRAALVKDRAALAKVQLMLTRERQLVTKLIAQLARARTILARQLVSTTRGDSPDIVSVVLDPRLQRPARPAQLPQPRRASRSRDHRDTKLAKAEADSAERRLAKLEAADPDHRDGPASRALAGMNTLLQAKQTALGRAREAQQSALAASRARGAQLQSAIARLQAQQAAAERAAERRPAAGGGERSSGSASQAGRAAATPGRDRPSAHPAAGRSRTRSCSASRAARTSRPTAPAPLATTRSSPAPGSCSAGRALPRTSRARPTRTPSHHGSGTAAPAPPTGSAPASSASTDARPPQRITSARVPAGGGVVAAILIGALALRVAEVERTSLSPDQRRRLVPDAGQRDRADRRLLLSPPWLGRRRYARPERLLRARLSVLPGAGRPGRRPETAARRGDPAGADRTGRARHDHGRADRAGRLEVFGETAGLIALALAAVYPVLIELSAVAGRREPADRADARRGVRRAPSAPGGAHRALAGSRAPGCSTGLATLTHENGVLLVIPLIARCGRQATPEAASLAAPALLVRHRAHDRPVDDPQRGRLHRFVPVSDETGITLAGTYNAASAANPRLPYKWRLLRLPGRARDPRAGR